MRGTTPNITFLLPFDTALVAKAKVAFQVGSEEVLVKNTADLSLSGQQIGLRLTRPETVSFPDRESIKVQLEIETTGGQALKTKVYSIFSGQLLDEGALE